MEKDLLQNGILIRKYVLAKLLANECQNSSVCPLCKRCPMECRYPNGFRCENITAFDWEEAFGVSGNVSEFLRITLTDYDLNRTDSPFE